MVALDHARHDLRHEPATRLDLHSVPERRFTQDHNPDVESRIDSLLKRAKRLRSWDER
jgi:ribosome-binding factor A